jgi:two-component system cell cycle sensor histidine kinase/response regulator CckA
MRAQPTATKIRRLEQALKESEARRQAVLESALDCIICTDSGGRITDFNSAAERTFRIIRAETLAKNLVDIIFPADLRTDHRRELFGDPALRGIDVLGTRLETRAVRANGVEFPAEVTVTCFTVKGDATFTVGIRDVTARKRAEETLVRLAAIVESSQDAIIGFDFEGCITNWNRGAERMSGYNEAEALGKSMLFLMPENRVFDYTRCIADLKASRSLENFETIWIAKNGRRLDVSLTTSSILNSDGEMVGGSIIAHDITARKLAEESLRKANETSIYGSPVPVVAADALGNVTMWNGAAERDFGWTEREVRGLPNPAIPAEEAEAAAELHRRMLNGETLTGIEVRRQRRDGASIDISLSGTPLWDENGKVRGIIGFLSDITERKRAELALREAEEKYRGIFENALEGIYQSTPDGKYISANPALSRMLGFHSPEELIKTSSTHPMEYLEPEKRVEFQALMKHNSRVHGFQYQLRRIDGTLLWVSENAHAVRDAAGQVLYYEGTVEDITRHRELEEQLRQMQKIEAIGRLAGGVAHDFNNILMAISSYAELLCRKLPEADPSRRYVDEIVRATDRGSSLTRGLLAFSRKQVLSPQIVDLNALIGDQINMLERLLGEAIILRFQPGAGLGRTKVDPSQVQQVVMNLVINARDAMPDGGEVLIETANAELDSCGSTPGARPSSEYVMISVTDTGCGIDEATKPHIFEPFFTTKEQGKGTGLGLATVFGIVKQSSGQIFLQSEPGMGSTFKVYFPRVEQPQVSANPSNQSPSIAGHETILLVEDQAAIRESAAEYLAENGYTVLQAQNGVEALEIVSQHTGMVHLLLTDVVMPKMSGKELSEKFAAVYPKAKVVFMSGYSNNVLSNHQALDRKHVLLQKPFRLNVLGQSIREVLNQNAVEEIAGG